MNKKIIGYGLIALLLTFAGCSGTLVTTRSSDNAGSNCETPSRSFFEWILREPNKKGCQGIPFRLKEPGMEYYSFTTATVKDCEKDCEGSAVITNQCSPDFLGRHVSVASQGLYYIYNNDSAWYESHKLGVTLNGDGTLRSVNTESSPDVAKKAVEVLGKAFVGTATMQARSQNARHNNPPACTACPVPVPACTAGPVSVFGQCSAKEDAGGTCQSKAKEAYDMWREGRDQCSAKEGAGGGCQKGSKKAYNLWRDAR